MPPTYRDVILADKPSNYWRLDEATGLLARDTVGGAHGTISGGVTLNQAGALADGNPAMRFDGTTGQIVTAAFVTVPVNVTVEAWVKTTKRGAAFMTALTTRIGSADPYLFIGIDTNVLFCFDGTNLASGVRDIADGQWHHVATVCNGSTAALYVDGALDATRAMVRAAPGSGGAKIGGEQVVGREWLGSLDEVAVYPVALTPAQIAAHYAAGYGLFSQVDVILRNKSGHAVLGYDEATATLSRLAQGGLVAATPLVEPVCWNKSGDPVLGYLEPTDALVVLAGGGLAPAPAVLAPRTYDALIRRDGPSNYWRLDEATGLLARDRVGGADGTISGGVTLNQAGPLSDGNPAMRFDGVNGKVQSAVPVAVPLALTLEAWIKTTATVGQTVFSNRAGSPVGDTVVVGTQSPGGGAFVMWFSTIFLAGTRVISDGRWHHLAWVGNGATIAIYMDGLLDVSAAETRSAASTGLAALGWDSAQGFYNGTLDEIAIYPVALTPAQIAQHYAAGYGIFPTVEPVLRSKSGHAVLGYNEATDQLSVLCQGTL